MEYKEELSERSKQASTSHVYGLRGYVFMEPLDEDMLNEIVNRGKKNKCSLCLFKGICG